MLKGVQIDLIRNAVLNSHLIKTTAMASVSDVISMWETTPWTLNDEHILICAKIAGQKRGKAVVYDVRTGRRIYP